MTAREFWEEEPSLMWAYRKSYIDQLTLQKEMSNYNAWLQGSYFYNAISVAIYNSFGRKNGQQAQNYLKEPYDMNSSEEELEKKETVKREENIKEALKRMKGAIKDK